MKMQIWGKAALTLAFILGFCAGGFVNDWIRGPKDQAIRISRAALDEIGFSQKCSGMQQDLAANTEYVYANCPGGPVTVQNYKFK